MDEYLVLLGYPALDPAWEGKVSWAAGNTNPTAGAIPEDSLVEEIEVSPSKKPPPQTPVPAQTQNRNPYSPEFIQLAQEAQQSQRQLPRVSGGTNTGLFGFLPPEQQTSRWRDILGAIGDGLLIGAGAQPMYLPRRDARLQGQALLGYQSDPQSALERLAQTGAPGSLDLMKSLQTEYQRSEDRAAQREMTQEYRNEVNRLKKEKVLQDLSKIVPGVLARATTPELYASAWDRLDQMVRRIDDTRDATTAFGIPYPEDWTPEMTAWYGVTGNQMITSDVQREAEQGRNTRLNVMESGRNYRTNLMEGGRNYRANLAESGRNERAKAKAKAKPKPKTQTSTARPQAGKVPPPVPGYPQARNMDVDWLRKNDTPQNRKIFERQFGPGTAKLFLGK